MRNVGRAAAAALGLMVVAAAVAIAAPSPAQRCAGSKLKAAAAAGAGLLGCHARAVKSGVAVDGDCVAKPHAKLATAFAKAEAKGGCASSGDGGDVTTRLDDFVAAVAAALAGGGTEDGRRCAAVKLKATAKKYGLILADNGSDWFVTGAPDPRWDDELMHDEFARITGDDFEVVE